MDIAWKDSIPLPLAQEHLAEYLQAYLAVLGYADRQIVLYLTNDCEIQALNQQYRGQNRPTDVLAWSYWEDDRTSEILGEIVISWDRVRVQAKTNGFSEEVELLRLLAHGCAHLVGYDHERSTEEAHQMLAVEIEMLTKVGLPDIYS